MEPSQKLSNNYYPSLVSSEADLKLCFQRPNTWMIRNSPKSGFCLSFVQNRNEKKTHILHVKLDVDKISLALEKSEVFCNEHHLKSMNYYGPMEESADGILHKIDELISAPYGGKKSFDFVKKTNQLLGEIENCRSTLSYNCIKHSTYMQKAYTKLEAAISKIKALKKKQAAELAQNVEKLATLARAFREFEKKIIPNNRKLEHILSTETVSLNTDIAFRVQIFILSDFKFSEFEIIKSFYQESENLELYQFCAAAISTHCLDLLGIPFLSKEEKNKISPWLTHFELAKKKNYRSAIKVLTNCSKLQSARLPALHLLKYFTAPENITDLTITLPRKGANFEHIEAFKNLHSLKIVIHQNSDPEWINFKGLKSESLVTLQLAEDVDKFITVDLIKKIKYTNPSLKKIKTPTKCFFVS